MNLNKLRKEALRLACTNIVLLKAQALLAYQMREAAMPKRMSHDQDVRLAYSRGYLHGLAAAEREFTKRVPVKLVGSSK